MTSMHAFHRRVAIAALVLALGGAAACATQTRNAVPPGTAQPDRFLFDRGIAALPRAPAVSHLRLRVVAVSALVALVAARWAVARSPW